MVNALGTTSRPDDAGMSPEFCDSERSVRGMFCLEGGGIQKMACHPMRTESGDFASIPEK